MFQTNVTGLINMTQAILPIFQKRPDGGAGDIINIGSIAGASPHIHCVREVRDGNRCRPRAVRRRQHLLRHQGCRS